MRNRNFCIMFFAVFLAMSMFFSAPAFSDIYADGSIDCTIANDIDFVPCWGKTYIAEDQYTRYIFQWFYWDKLQRLTWLIQNYDSTFEPDAFFYNFDDQKAYGEKPIGYWASDLPSPYVDTQFLDGSDEKAVTIGSANATLINSGRVYYTVTRMTSGGGNSSWVKLSSQRGRRWPYWCYDEYCSFGCHQQANNIKTLPYRAVTSPSLVEFTAPGCARYWYKWSITTYKDCL